MDESNYTFAACFSFANLMDASYKCAKGVRWKRQVQMFLADNVVNCAKLYKELHGGTYQMRHADKYHIMERGKPRDVKSINYRDRVVQRCLADHVLVPLVMKNMTEESSACIKGRGLDYALSRVKYHLGKAGPDAWVLRYDFHDYFHTIDKDKLMAYLSDMIEDERLLDLFRHILSQEHPGLELGSHISQICAVYYPDKMDRMFIDFGYGYHRYMDDGEVVCPNGESVQFAMALLKDWVERLGLQLNERKTLANKATHPHIFCQKRIRKRPGGVTINMRKKSTRRTVRRLKKVKKLHLEGRIKNIESPIASTLGYLNSGDADLTRLLSDI